MSMLQSCSQQGFSDRASSGLTYDWKDWQCSAHGYEGFLVNNYDFLLAVLDHAHMLKKIPSEAVRANRPILADSTEAHQEARMRQACRTLVVV
jgi:hypothetical protein